MPLKLATMQGGVPGGQNRLQGAVPLTPEVKYFDQGISIGNVVDWQFAQTGALAGIINGSGQRERIGRQIRLVGIIYRMTVQSGRYTVPVGSLTAIGVTPAAYTIDFILDKQSQAGAPAITGSTGAIYDSNSVYNLPNPEAQDRFLFMRRVEVRDPQTVHTTVSGVIHCNKIIDYNNSTAVATDLQSNSVLVTTASNAAPGVASATVLPYQVTGIIRYMYVDV